MSKGFGRIEKRRQKLEERKDCLNELKQIVPWEVFRSSLEELVPKERESNAGRKPIDLLLLFKVLILAQLYNLSDEDVEYQSHDRASFRRFLGLEPTAEIPDATTIWLFRKRLTDAGLIDKLFEEFGSYLNRSGYEAKGGQIIDATLIPVPIQRNSREENQTIKNGEIPPEWEDAPHKRSQKDSDARWTAKNGEKHFGYKNHINIDAEHGFIRNHIVTDASVHDSQKFSEVLDGANEGDQIWADSAYRSQANEEALNAIGYESEIHERGYRNHPLTEEQKESNRTKSKVRARVEHVFGTYAMSMGGKRVRCIGLQRVTAQLGLKDLAYNLKRYVFWQKKDQGKLQVQWV